MKKFLTSLLLGLSFACDQDNNNNNNNNNEVGTAEVTSDPINDVQASAAFSFIGGIVTNDLDIDNDGTQDDSTITFVAVLTDSSTFCDDLNTALLTGNNEALGDGLGGNAVLITMVRQVIDAQSDLTNGGNFIGDGDQTDITVGFNAADETTLLVDAQNDGLGSLNLTFDPTNTTFSGNFSSILTLDTSGQQAFDVDTDGDTVNDATAINANISGEFAGAQICGGVEGIALLLGLFAGL
jgi:hypothetical protein